MRDSTRFITCEECGDDIATIKGKRFDWLDNTGGVSVISERELCGHCLDKEMEDLK